MKEQSEALRLAEDMERPMYPHYNPQAAAELRRLHEAHDWQYRMAGERLRRIEKLEAQRDALLKVLKEAELVLAEKLRRLGADPNVSPTTHRIRAAIEAVEENT